jgi:RHS repeat-associated protein
MAIGRVLDDGTTQLTLLAYNAFGNLTALTDPFGRQTSLTYAGNNIDVTAVAQATGNGPATIAAFTWNSGIHRPLTATDAAGQVTTYTYNAAGQPTTVSNPLGQTTTYAYNATGDLLSIVNADGKVAASFTYDGFDRVASYTDADGWTVGVTYDDADRPRIVTYPDGTTERYTYNLLDLASHTDRLGHVWSYVHDADRRLVSVADPNGNATQLGYYRNGALDQLTDANGNVTSWDVDAESRPTAKNYNNGTATSYAYQATTSLLHALTDARGEERVYGYTLDNRLKSISYLNTISVTSDVGFSWDRYFPLLDAMSDGNGTTNYGYYPPGALGALQPESESGTDATIGYGYDALGRLISRSVGSAPTETFGYDAIGRLVRHRDALGSFALSYLGETGQLTGRGPTAGGLATTWQYRDNVHDRRLASIANTPGRAFAYTTTPADLVTAIAETPSPPGQAWGFSYDAANRLTGGQSTSEGSYAYGLDPVGNITAFGTTPATYNGVNELKALGGTAYGWDKDGNLAGDGVRSFAWDGENRLVGITYPSGAMTEFLYDGLGRRVTDIETSAAGTTTDTHYIWCGDTLCQSQNGNSAIVREYYPEGEYLPASGAALYYGPDQLGSARDVYATSPVMSMTEAWDYDPLGNPIATPPSAPYPDFRYAGLFWHQQSGLDLSRSRVYDPAIGRWLSRDPLGEATDPSANLFRYADGNPISLKDPLGYWGTGIIASESAEVGGIFAGVGEAASAGLGYFWGARMAFRGGAGLGASGALPADHDMGWDFPIVRRRITWA